MIITSYTGFNRGLNEYPRHLKGAKLHQWIYKQLKRRSRISVWEIDSDPRMLRTLMWLVDNKKLRFNSNDVEYPHTRLEVV